MGYSRQEPLLYSQRPVPWHRFLQREVLVAAAAAAAPKEMRLTGWLRYVCSGRFYPTVWVRTNGVKVQANFGHEPFLFEFVSTLPEGYLEGMEHMENKAKVMTIQEIKRRTQAEELMMMMGVFPLELCVVSYLVPVRGASLIR